MAPTDIYLVRHAESVWNAVGRWQGQADPPLSPYGREQARSLAEQFPHNTITHIFTSDLQRAADTAQPLAQRFGLEPIVDPNLRELDVGSWSGRTRAEIGADDPDSLDRFFHGEVGWIGGETYAEHEARATLAAERLVSLGNADGAAGAVAVTHGGTLRAIVLAMLEIDPALRWRFSGIDHTSITHLRNGPHGYRLVAYNSVLDLERV